MSKNAGSSNGRTLDFGSSNRGSSPCPAAKKTFKARAPRKSIAGCCVPGLATLAVATVPSATQGASPGSADNGSPLPGTVRVPRRRACDLLTGFRHCPPPFQFLY